VRRRADALVGMDSAPDLVGEFVRGAIFCEVSRGAESASPRLIIFRGLQAQHNHGQCGTFVFEIHQYVKTIFSRHDDIKQYQIVAIGADKFEGFITVCRFTTDDNVKRRGKESSHAFANCATVIYDEESNLFALRRHRAVHNGIVHYIVGSRLSETSLHH